MSVGLDVNNFHISLEQTNINPKYVDIFSMLVFGHFKYLDKIPELGHSVENIKNILKSFGKVLFFLFANNFLIGYVIAENKSIQDGRFVCYIDYIYVSEQFRSKNYGQKMLNSVINYCKKNSIKFLMLTFDTKDVRLNKFYKKNNFTRDNFIKTDIDGNQVFSLFI